MKINRPKIRGLQRKMTTTEKIQADLKAHFRNMQECLPQIREFVRKSGIKKRIYSTDFELVWDKRGGQLPNEITAIKGYHACYADSALQKGKTIIHFHPRGGLVPSVSDLRRLVEKEKKRKGCAMIIAVTYKRRQIGYAFLTVRDLEKAKQIETTSDKELSINQVREIGINMRVLPLPGYRFNPEIEKFVKAGN
jgi:hypothetical protein